MIFKTLYIENIRSYNNKRIDFPMGTSLFEGDVGSGKSTILMALEFALFGLGNQKGDSLLRKGSKKGSVVLNFSVDEKEYQVKRSLVRNENNNSIRQDKGILGVNGKKMQLSPSEIKEKILNILHFKEPLNPRAQSVIFRYAVYTPQEEMKFILSQKPDLRLETLRKAFGIEDYKIALENASSISRLLKDRISYLSGQILDLDEKKNQLADLKDKFQRNQEYLTNLNSSMEQIELKLGKEKEKLDKLKSIETELKQVKAEIPHIKNQFEDKGKICLRYNDEIRKAEEENHHKYQPEIKKLEELEIPTTATEDNLKNKINFVTDKIKKQDGFLAKLSLLNESKEEMENKLKENKNKEPQELQREKNILIKKLEDQSDLLDSHQRQLNKITERTFKLEAQKEDINNKLDNIDGLGDLCPICGSLLDEEHKKNLKKERKKEFKRLNSELTVLTDVKNKGEKELKAYDEEHKNIENDLRDLEIIINKLNDYNTLNDKIKSIISKISKIDDDLELIMGEDGFEDVNHYLNHLTTLTEKIKDYRRAQEELKSLRYYLEKNVQKINENKKIIATIKQEMKLLKDNLYQAQSKVEKMSGVMDEIDELRKEHETTEQEFKDYNQKIIYTKTLIESYSADIVKVEEEIQKKEDVLKRLNNLKDYHIWLNDYMIPTLNIIEKHVMQNIHLEFDDNFKKWLHILLDDPSKTGRINEEFTPIIEQDGFEQEINYLSGGEKTSVALAYRLALNNMVKKVSTGMESNLLILDEPTDGFSKEQLYKVREILNELDCPQIIIVSHERELESFADNVFQIEKIDGVSEVSQVT
ncbi:MAG: SMC family ATPase [Methanobacterium sp.]|nr:SMC family ATPase [Methanobacterium sp.]